MKNILMDISFIGTAYHGFQVQENAVTVCEKIQDALECVFGERPPVKGCSRTDSGVHALHYSLSFFMPGDMPPEKAVKALNAHLPWDIRVNSASEVPSDFHARYSCRGKRYIYRILNSGVDSPFESGRAYRVAPLLDIDAMRLAAGEICGKKDFCCFMSAGSNIKDTVRNIYSLEIEKENDIILIKISADGYLYNMVRIIVGTLIMAGRHKLLPEDIKNIIESRDRSLAGPTVPPYGLYLDRAFYDES